MSVTTTIPQHAGNGKPPPTIRIKLWWPGYSPEEALDPLIAWEHQSSRAFEISTKPGQWRHPRPGASLGDVTGWMEETGRSVLGTHLLKQRSNGRWEGLFLLEIGQEVAR